MKKSLHFLVFFCLINSFNIHSQGNVLNAKSPENLEKEYKLNMPSLDNSFLFQKDIFGIVSDSVQFKEMSDYLVKIKSTKENKFTASLKEILDFKVPISLKMTENDTGNNLKLGLSFLEVNLQLELAELFNPDKFICKIDDKLKKKLKEEKLKNTDGKGFIPSSVSSQITDIRAYKLDFSGTKILANGFSYKIDNIVSKLLVPKNSPSYLNYNRDKYISVDDDTYNYFFYTLDCSGYVSASLEFGAGVGTNAIKASANGATDSNKSLMIFKGLLYSPLYSAILGKDDFKISNSTNLSEADKKILVSRISVLNSILDECVGLKDDTTLMFNANYLIVIVSNTGTSNFNGNSKMSTSGGFGVGIVSGGGSADASASITRKAEFANYSTYVVDSNINQMSKEISIIEVKNIITDLKSKLN